MTSKNNTSPKQASAHSHGAGIPASVPRIALSVIEAAKALGLSRSTLYLLIDRRQLKTVYVGTRHLVPMESLNAFMADLLAKARH